MQRTFVGRGRAVALGACACVSVFQIMGFGCSLFGSGDLESSLVWKLTPKFDDGCMLLYLPWAWYNTLPYCSLVF